MTVNETNKFRVIYIINFLANLILARRCKEQCVMHRTCLRKINLRMVLSTVLVLLFLFLSGMETLAVDLPKVSKRQKYAAQKTEDSLAQLIQALQDFKEQVERATGGSLRSTMFDGCLTRLLVQAGPTQYPVFLQMLHSKLSEISEKVFSEQKEFYTALAKFGKAIEKVVPLHYGREITDVIVGVQGDFGQGYFSPRI